MDKATLFFSYARHDAAFALKLAQDLRSAGANVWMDQLDIPAGKRWDEAVQDALEACEGVLLVLSPQSVESQNVLDEVSYALDEGKHLLPILHRACEIPFRLRRLQYIDFTADYATALDRLLNTLDVARASRLSQPSPPSTRLKKRYRWQIPLIGAGVLAIGMVIAFALWPAKVAVPSVLGTTLDEARNTLVDAGFTVDAPTQIAGGGRVIRTEPAGGAKATKGSPVMLYTSVPHLAASSLDEAEATLNQAGLHLGDVRRDVSGDVSKDHVVRSDPAAEAEVRWGAAIDLVISMGLPTAEELGLRDQKRPVQPGVSISSTASSVGTLCCIVRDAEGTRYLLSADIVFLGTPGTPIVQPGSFDGGSAADAIAVLSRRVLLQPDQENATSGAIASLNPNVEVSSEVVGLGRFRGTTSDVQPGDTLRLVGRGAGIIEVMVERLNASVSMAGLAEGNVRLVGLIETTRTPREGGDAGAPVLTKDGKLVGIVYGGSQTAYLIMPIERILGALGVDLVQ